MPNSIRRFRGLGIALAVLAISAGAVFASTPTTRPSAHAADQARTHATAALPSHPAEPSAKAEAPESPDPSEAAETADPASSPEAAGTPDPNTHGALVSTAAQMPTPSGFPNHGAFVSCVAHLKVTLTGFDWTTVTPASCGVTPKTGKQATSGHANHASANGAQHSAAGKAKGAAARASHAPATGH